MHEDRACGRRGALLYSQLVQPRTTARSSASLAKSALAAGMALLLLLTSLLAVSPVHNQSHLPQQGGSGHDCALCLFSHGQVDLADLPPALAVRNPVSADCFIPHTVSFVSAPDYQLLPGRAPPFFS